ncbi:glycosyl hydrolase [Sphingomonas floccifaciens]|uniref:Glycosyl hydrolase n=1 Tax=Sphingomonas floccifaciens TaxID=1844115 RepID=A0ABW4N9I1_9SPHN
MRRLVSGVALLALAVSAAAGAQTADPLAEGFRDPPADARPRTWWHWLNGNISEEGITRDLEWMKRVGLGGVQNFDASLMAPQIVEKRVPYMSPEWQRAFAHSARTADRLGLELAIASSAGWSETGGPWVAPADGMKKLVWSEVDVDGGKRLAGAMPRPPSVTGAYGSAPFSDPLAAFEGGHPPAKPQASGDVRVLAWPIPAKALGQPRATAAGAAIDAAALVDADEASVASVPKGDGTTPPAIVYDYAAPVTVQAATFYMPDALPPFGDPAYLPVLEVAEGTGWRRLAELPLSGVPTTVAFAPVTAARFRIVLGPNTGPKRPPLDMPVPGAQLENIFPSPKPSTSVPIGTFRLDAGPRVDRFEAKAGFATVGDYYALDGRAPEAAGVAPASVIDLTDRLRPDGTLDWTAPKGSRWRVVRLGWSLIGKTNHPATPDSTGLEVDKMDGAAVRRYLDTYLARYKAAAGEGMIGARGVRALLTDSIEAGPANWTPALLDRFKALRGYDPTPWLPALTGVVVDSRARSDAFLYDWRRTLADLVASEHYGTVARVAHDAGLTVYGEALEDQRPQLGDDMAMRAHADVPMAAMWTFRKDGAPRPTLIGDALGAASIAHVAGKRYVAAESFTSFGAPWAFAPADLKRVADLEFALGINRPVIHTSVHNPVESKAPGLSLAVFGQYFNRFDSWAEMARPWVDYLARTGFLLQQGRHVADVAWFYGEEAPLTAIFGRAVPADLPTRHGFDMVNAAILAELKVDGRELATPGGARYRALYLGGSSARMTLPTLRRVVAIAEAGIPVIGAAPTGSPALGDDVPEYRALVARLQPKLAPIAGGDIDAALVGAGITPDLTVTGGATPLFQHRRTDAADIYFLSSRSPQAASVEARFRVAPGRRPEIWHADTGVVEAVSYRRDGDTVVVPLDLAAEDSRLVIFRGTGAADAMTAAAQSERVVATLDSAWSVSLQPGRGAPETITLDRLAGLETQADPAVRYFSGIATYRRTIDLPKTAAAERLSLDLGQVGDVAEVRVNGRVVGQSWHAPWRVALGDALRPGRNTIEVRVANLWVNRLIGDAQPGATKVTWTSLPTYRPDAPLRPSGLIGPVRILATSAK